jgi:hypothetical protein
VREVVLFVEEEPIISPLVVLALLAFVAHSRFGLR